MAYFYQGNISTTGITVNGTSKFKGVEESTPGILQIYDNNGSNYTQIQAPSIISTNYTLTLPTNDGDANQFLQTNGDGILNWGSPSILSNGGDNRVITSNNLNEINGEENLLFDGTNLLIKESGQTQYRGDAIHIASNSATDLTITSNGTINLVSTNRTTFITATSNIASVDATGIDLASGKSYQINNTDVLTESELGSSVLASSLTSVGTLDGLTVQSSNNSADIIKLHADAGISQTINILNDEGTSNSAIALTSNAGGITLSSKNLFYNTDTINVGIGGDITSLTANGTVRDPIASTVLLKSIGGGGVFSETNILNASDGVANDYFGYSVSISGIDNDAVAIIGAYGDDDNGNESGSAYIFDKSSGSLAQVAKLMASDGAAADKFGFSVAISGTGNDAVAIIGANGNDSSKGSAYIFDKSSGSWVQIAKLVASDGANGDEFGVSVAISGTGNNAVAIIGAFGDDSAKGSAYIFDKSDGSWTQIAKLVASDGNPFNLFGNSVSIYGTGNNAVAIIGAFSDDDNFFNSGAAYIFDKSSGSWAQISKLVASDGAISDNFGNSVSISGTGNDAVAIIGAYGDDSQKGSSYIFDKSSGSWAQIDKLVASDGAAYEHFGYSVSISGTGNDAVAIIGARLDSIGSAYIFDKSSGSWEQIDKLVPSDGVGGFFGNSVSISGNSNNSLSIIGAYGNDSQKGSSYIFSQGNTFHWDLTGFGDDGQLLNILYDNSLNSSISTQINFGTDNLVTRTGLASSIQLNETGQGISVMYTGTSGSGVWRTINTGDGDIDMATGKKITWVDDNQYISGTATGITIESDDTLVVNADTSITMDAPSVIFTSSTTEKPLFEIVNDTNDATGSHLRLANKRGANNGANADVAGTIDFFTNDAANNNQSFGEIKVVATAATSGSEQGTMTFGVACTDDGGVDTVLTITGGANAAVSTTTVAGGLNIFGNIDVATGKTYKINNTDVLTATSLGSNVVASSLTSVGTIGTGIWEGTAIASAYLDADTAHLSETQTFTGDKTFGNITITGCITQGSDASGDMYYRNASGVLTRLAVGTDNQVLTSNGAVPGWEDLSLGTLDGLTVQTSNNSADIIKLHADAGALQTINIVNDEGTSNSAIALTSNAGGITLSSKNLFYNTDTINVGIDGDITSLTADGTVRNPIASTVLLKSVDAYSDETKIIASDGDAGDFFGSDVSISGTGNDAVAIIGASDNDSSNSGSAYIFDKSGGSWAQIAKLVASDGVNGDEFGYSVSISGTGNNAVAIIGAPSDDSYKGSAYIFDKSSGSWTQIAKLVASDGAAGDYFGVSVSISGTGNDAVAIIGASNDDDDSGSDSGSAYIFDKSSGSWAQITKLVASDGASGDIFGVSVSIFGTGNDAVAIIGAYSDDDSGSNSGSAYIFDKSGGSWAQIAKLVASDGAANDFFGISVSISGTGNDAVAIIGTYGDDSFKGSSYIFDKSSGSWAKIAKLVANDGVAGDIFGFSVSISGTGNNAIAIIGVYGSDSNKGSAYIFDKSGGSWAQIAKLVASDGASWDRFGNSVSISGNSNNSLSIIGAYGNDSQKGSSYIFSQGNTFHWDLTGFGDDGQLLNILYDNSLNSSISTQINFGTDNLVTRTGLASSIQLNETGQGISIMYSGANGSGVWRIINIGDGDIDMSSGKKITWVDDTQYISGTSSGITIEADDTLVVNADTSITMDAPSVIFTSSTTEKPLFEIVNATNDATGSHLRLANKRGANNGANADVAGTIDFFTNDAAQNNQSFGEIKVVATAATSGSEQGTMTFGVACTDDGGVDTVLTIEGGANAAGSTTTIAGNLDVSAGVDVTGSITCSVDLDIEGDIDMATGKKITWVDDTQYITGNATAIVIDSDDILIFNADTSMTFDAPSVIFTSSTTEKPVLEIKNTNADTTGPTLLLNNASGTAAGSDTDVCGTIAFNANDDDGTSPNNQSFATIIGTAVDTASGSEKGKIEIGVACTGDGGVDTVLTIEGGADAAGSTTTIAGDFFATGVMCQFVLTQTSTTSYQTVSIGQTGAYIAALTLNITPKKANSIIKIEAQINHESSPELTSNILFFLGQTIGGTTTALQAPAHGSKGLGLTIATPSRPLEDTTTMDVANVCYFDSPGTTSQITYTIGVKSMYSGFAIALNRTISDADNTECERTISFISATEITQ